VSTETRPPAERFDELFGLLADSRRRHAVAVLEAYGERLSLADVADEVASMEAGRPLPELSAETVLEVYCALYHTHVPLLERADVVCYDQQTDTVSLVADPDELAPFLEHDPAIQG
jgi:hypothetical protein